MQAVELSLYSVAENIMLFEKNIYPELPWSISLFLTNWSPTLLYFLSNARGPASDM